MGIPTRMEVLGRWLATALALAILLSACSAALSPAATPTPASPPQSTARPTALPTGKSAGYANPDLLVDPEWLAAHLSDPKVRVVALAPRADYLRGHVPGAVQIDWPDLQVTDTSDPSIAAWQSQVEGKLGELGIDPGDTVVVYDHGSLFAARLWWILDQLGHKDKRILDGGLPAWQQAGKPVASDETTIRKATYQSQPGSSRLASWQYVLDHLKDPHVVLVDARSPDEYSGKNTSGAKHGGHIPGAVNLNYVENARPEEPRYFKPQAELAQLYAGLGVTRDKEVIPYCTTGVRGAVTYFSLKLIGYPDVRLYTGSWAEWGNREDLPIER